MFRPTLSTAARRTTPLFSAAAVNTNARKGPKTPTVSKVNGATGPDGDSATDKLMVAGCLSAVAAWFVFGPPIKSHH